MWIPYDISGSLKAATAPETIRQSRADLSLRVFLVGFLLRNPVTQAWELDLVADPALPGVRITATARTTGRTGVEMEALTAATVAALTVYDMLKAAQKDMRIEGVRLLKKTGGKSGTFEAAP